MIENTPNETQIVPKSKPSSEPSEMLAETHKLYRWTALELIRLINAMNAASSRDLQAGEGKAGEIRAGEAKAAGQTIRDLRTALGWAIDESSHVEKIGKSLAASGGNGAELDIGSARDEIGRRLSRLRAAADERSVSEQSE